MSVLLDTNMYPLDKSIEDSPADYRTKGVDFGDGYRQSVLDGINFDREKWNLIFVPQNDARSLALKTLLKGSVAGTANLLAWTPPGESELKYWKATQVKRVPVDIEWIVSCVIDREFPLVV